MNLSKDYVSIKYLLLNVNLLFCCLFVFSAERIIPPTDKHFRIHSSWDDDVTLLHLKKSRSGDEGCAMSNCFNFSKCFAQKTLKVYVYSDRSQLKGSPLYSKMLKVLRESHFNTERADEACLFVLSADTTDRDRNSEHYQKIEEEHVKTELWDDGLNHLVFNLYFGTFPDYANTNLGFDLGKAMVAWASSNLQHFQSHFPNHDKYLASFKGKRYVYGIGSKTRNILHHLNDDKSMVIATTCKHNTDWRKFEDERCEVDNANYGRWDYGQLMMNSTFCLIPRGRRLGSFRFLEALRSVCIPVILSDEWVLPFSEVIDWSEAVIFGKECAALFIYDSLSRISEKRIFQMRQMIQFLYSKYFSSIERIVLTSVEIVFERVRQNLGNPSRNDWMCRREKCKETE